MYFVKRVPLPFGASASHGALSASTPGDTIESGAGPATSAAPVRLGSGVGGDALGGAEPESGEAAGEAVAVGDGELVGPSVSVGVGVAPPPNMPICWAPPACITESVP